MQKKGEFKAARTRHIAKQELYDAIKWARETGESWVNLDDKRLHLKSPDFMLDAVFGEYSRALVMTRDGGILLGEITDKDGISFFPDDHHFDHKTHRETGPRCHKIQYGDIMALVIEEHPRDQS